MCRLALLTVLLAAPAASAQTPDPTPPWTYDPVDVGNVRAYYTSVPTPQPYDRTDSPAALDSLGERWVVRRTHRYELVGPDWGEVKWMRTEERRLVRYDTAAANVLTVEDGEARSVYPCRLDLPLPEGECVGGVSSTYAVDLDAVVSVGGVSVQTPVRSFDGVLPGPSLASGIGVASYGGATDLLYAVVGGDTLGTLPASFPQVASDTTPPWLYYPLAVGNEWQYEYGANGPGGSLYPETFVRRRVTDTRVVEGQTYFVVEGSQATPSDPVWSPPREDLLRFDTLSARVVTPEGRSVTPCPFDEPVNVPLDYEDDVACDVETGYYLAFRSGPASDEQENGLVVTSEAFKVFRYVGLADGVSPEVYAAGVGYLPNTSGAWSPIGYAALAYARVRQEDGNLLELGARVVAGEDEPEASALALRVGPNPTPGPLAVAFSLDRPAEVTAEAFDALGRRVWRHETALGAGRQRVEVDAGAWAPGLYVVRVTAGGEAATARVVRR
jgi:hypothetical protein